MSQAADIEDREPSPLRDYFDFKQFCIDTVGWRRYVPTASSKRVLQKIVDFATNRLHSLLGPDTVLFRCRMNEPNAEAGYFYPVTEMGAPPPQKATPGRINPAGIPYLYAASDERTAVAELRPWKGARMTVACLKLNRNARLLDLTDSIGRESNFGGDEHWLAVMESVRSAFSEPVHRDDPVAYTSTQYLSELFLDAGFEAVKYPSYLSNGGNNFVIFDPRLVDIFQPKQVVVYQVSVLHKDSILGMPG